MEGRVNYTIVGIFVISLCALLLAGVIWLGAFSHGKVYHAYIVYMSDDVSGLNIESPVRFNGVKVGYVESIVLDRQNSKLVKVVLRIEPDVPITTSTYAVLVPQGITGIVTVNLSASTEQAPLLVAKSGQEYPEIPSHPSLLSQVSSVLPGIANDFRKVTQSVTLALNQQNLDALHDSLMNIDKLTKTLADNSENFTQTMNSIHHASANIAKASDQLPEATQRFNAAMLEGERLIRNFSTQVIPPTQQTMENLSHASYRFNQFVAALQRNPSMLLRGQQSHQPGPGEH